MEYMKNGRVNLFQTANDDYPCGALRDFVYVKDVVRIIRHFIENDVVSGLYNVGTSNAHSFDDLVLFTVRAILRDENVTKDQCINYVTMPEDLRERYQYYTCADVKKLYDSEYSTDFYSLRDGINDYVGKYLLNDNKYY